MSLEAIIAKDAAILGAVSGIGKVYDYQREARDMAAFKNLFVDVTGQIRFWDLHRESSGREQQHLNGVNDRPHVILIRGFMALRDADATGKTFRQLVEAVCNAFRPLHDLQGVALKAEPLIVTVEGQGMFSDVLCHYAELRQSVVDRIQF